MFRIVKLMVAAMILRRKKFSFNCETLRFLRLANGMSDIILLVLLLLLLRYYRIERKLF